MLEISLCFASGFWKPNFALLSDFENSTLLCFALPDFGRFFLWILPFLKILRKFWFFRTQNCEKVGLRAKVAVIESNQNNDWFGDVESSEIVNFLSLELEIFSKNFGLLCFALLFHFALLCFAFEKKGQKAKFALLCFALLWVLKFTTLLCFALLFEKKVKKQSLLCFALLWVLQAKWHPWL